MTPEPSKEEGMRCLYFLVYRCEKEAVGVSRLCEEHLEKQQKHAQRMLKYKRKVKTP